MSFTAGAGTRFVVTSTTNPSGGSTVPGPFTITGGTATTNTPVLDATQTWNAGAVTFTGWRLNVTDTASNAASLLMDLQVGGTSQFKVAKNGDFFSGVRFSYNDANGDIRLANNRYGFSNRAVWLSNNQIIVWNSTSNVGSSSLDVSLSRDAANTLAQSNGVNAQTFRVYNTFTDASNYERGFLSWSTVSNRLGIGTEAAGTGSKRALDLYGSSIQFRPLAGNNNAAWEFNNSGHFIASTDNTYDIGATGASRPRNVFWAGYQEMSEMTAPAAPAANSVRIYAEDNGSGKTRLMALFPTGVAQQIAIEP